jgi:hypothetical protein
VVKLDQEKKFLTNLIFHYLYYNKIYIYAKDLTEKKYNNYNDNKVYLAIIASIDNMLYTKMKNYKRS